MSTSTKSLSARYMSVRYGVTEKTARLFMLKVREAMCSNGNNPMDGNVHVDEFVLGGEIKVKQVEAMCFDPYKTRQFF